MVAKGTLGPDNVLDVVPDGIMAKCPSKYDTKGGAKDVGDPAATAAATPTNADKP